jgi:hypothetical protein
MTGAGAPQARGSPTPGDNEQVRGRRGRAPEGIDGASGGDGSW